MHVLSTWALLKHVWVSAYECGYNPSGDAKVFAPVSGRFNEKTSRINSGSTSLFLELSS